MDVQTIAFVLAVLYIKHILSTKYKISAYNTSVYQDEKVLKYVEERNAERTTFKLYLLKDIDRLKVRIQVDIVAKNKNNYPDVYANYINKSFDACNIYDGKDIQNTILRFFLKLQVEHSDFIKLPTSCPVKAVRFLYGKILYGILFSMLI